MKRVDGIVFAVHVFGVFVVDVLIQDIFAVYLEVVVVDDADLVHVMLARLDPRGRQSDVLGAVVAVVRGRLLLL